MATVDDCAHGYIIVDAVDQVELCVENRIGRKREKEKIRLKNMEMPED